MTAVCPSCRKTVAVWPMVLAFSVAAMFAGAGAGFGFGWILKPDPRPKMPELQPGQPSSWEMLQWGAKRAEERDAKNLKN